MFLGLLLGDAVAEYAAMLRTGTLRRKHRREWTYYAVSIPYRAMFATALIEYVSLQTRPAPTFLIVGTLLATTGIVIRVRGHLELKGAFSPYVEKSEDQKLVQSGMYATIRHPMYVGANLLFVGMPMVLGAKWAWLFSALALAGVIVRIHREEEFLTREFPDYADYIQRTWRLLPHIY